MGHPLWLVLIVGSAWEAPTPLARKKVVSGRIEVYDTTLRDGTQGEGVSVSCEDKLAYARQASKFGVDYIEAGWPGSNPKDAEFFRRSGELDPETRRKLVAFGSTRRKGVAEAGSDPQLAALVRSGCQTVCIVCKSSAWQTEAILGTSLEENLEMISSSVGWLAERGVRVHVDLEHFFDGYKASEAYAVACCRAAVEAGAEALVLCDTNGGALPWEIEAATSATTATFPSVKVGIHAHNDAGLAVANSLAACRAGAKIVQCTTNGVGERCGNADLCAIVATLQLKDVGGAAPPECELRDLTRFSRFVDETLNRAHADAAPYVGASAFAHKGGLHVSAVSRDPRAYEHVDPSLVGNAQRVLVSELSGRANIWTAIENAGLVGSSGRNDVRSWRDRSRAILDRVKKLEALGYSFEGAPASVHLMLLHASPGYCLPFAVADYSVTTSDYDLDSSGRALRKSEKLAASENTARATVKVVLAGKDPTLDVAEGNGPVDALFFALQRALEPTYPTVANVRIADYKVRILDPVSASRAATRVMITFKDLNTAAVWTTVAVDRNVISASANALVDGFEFAVIEHADFCVLCDDDDDDDDDDVAENHHDDDIATPAVDLLQTAR
ncbi:hypothetical protein CTAYLR_006538 [Chrysophaeum taylorii]|uniref:(R)-citramalate synthase n=1 Tax=Chrysophaeum taylorii TaxID=2483200 RepID=A0AAD7UFH2_9STRA|nr:hypothetical protein CTAYLR_006538 [Chrysophaeum taylorii]